MHFVWKVAGHFSIVCNFIDTILSRNVCVTFQLLLDKFLFHQERALEKQKQEKAEREAAEKRRKERQAKKEEEERKRREAAETEPAIKELTDEEAERLQKELDQVLTQ